MQLATKKSTDLIKSILSSKTSLRMDRNEIIELEAHLYNVTWRPAISRPRTDIKGVSKCLLFELNDVHYLSAHLSATTNLKVREAFFDLLYLMIAEAHKTYHEGDLIRISDMKQLSMIVDHQIQPIPRNLHSIIPAKLVWPTYDINYWSSQFTNYYMNAALRGVTYQINSITDTGCHHVQPGSFQCKDTVISGISEQRIFCVKHDRPLGVDEDGNSYELVFYRSDKVLRIYVGDIHRNVLQLVGKMLTAHQARDIELLVTPQAGRCTISFNRTTSPWHNSLQLLLLRGTSQDIIYDPDALSAKDLATLDPVYPNTSLNAWISRSKRIVITPQLSESLPQIIPAVRGLILDYCC